MHFSDSLALIFKLLARLPLPLLHGLGNGLGWLVYLLSPRYRSRIKANLDSSGLGQNQDGFLRRRAIGEAGKAVLELPAIWLRPVEKLEHLVRGVYGWEYVEQTLAGGKGIIFLSPHLGCYEIASLYYATQRPITVLYRPPRQRWLEPLMRLGRGRANARLATADISGVRTIMKALKRGEAVGILPDQVPSRGEGVWADFFGRPAYTMTLVARLQQATEAQVVLAVAERLSWGRGYILRFRPMTLSLAGNAEESARALNASIEDLVREYPAQYLWSYNRYKVPPGVTRPSSEQ